MALVDPLAVDVQAFAPLLTSDVLCVIHAAQQDLDVLTHAAGAVPARMFDTQIAAGFVGYGTPSLVSLLQGEVGVSPPKGDRLTDWLRRPLSDDQMQYAAVDVEYLLEVHDLLAAKLAAAGRTEWVDEACEELRTKPVSGATPDEAWLRLKDCPHAAAQCPRRRASRGGVAGTAGDARRHPGAPGAARSRRCSGSPSALQERSSELSQSRGVDDRHAKGAIAEEILAAVREGKDGAASVRAGDGRRSRTHLAPGGRADLGLGEPTRPR